MTKEERELLADLGNCYNKFIEMPILHHSDQGDFCFHIHALQNIVFARDGMRNIDNIESIPDCGHINKSSS